MNFFLRSAFILALLSIFFTNPVLFAQQEEMDPECGCPDFMSYDARSLEEALENPEAIKSLDMAMRKLTTLDARIGELKNLECLDLSFNRFSTFPEEFKNLTNLKCLIIQGTHFIPKLPDLLTELPNLKYVDVRDHHLWKAETREHAKKLLPDVKVVTD